MESIEELIRDIYLYTVGVVFGMFMIYGSAVTLAYYSFRIKEWLRK